MRRAIGILGTVTVHLWALVLIVSAHRAAGHIPPYLAEVRDVEVTLIGTGQSIGEVSRGGAASGDLCPPDTKHYLGIGIVFRASGAITSAPANLPAGRAGIRAGDFLFERFPTFRARQAARVRIMRQGQILTFMIVPEMVCFREAEPPVPVPLPLPQLTT
jgi:hypothetical protein